MKVSTWSRLGGEGLHMELYGILQVICLIKHINAMIGAPYIDVSIVMDGNT